MDFNDFLNGAIVAIESSSREELDGYYSTLTYHVDFGDGLAHDALEALTQPNIPKRGSKYPNPAFDIYARRPKCRTAFEDRADYFFVTIDFGPKLPEDQANVVQNPLTMKTKVVWQTNLVDEFRTVDSNDLLIAADNGQVIGTTVPVPLWEGTARWNQRFFETGQFDDKIGRINELGFKLGNYYFPPKTFMPLGVADDIASFQDALGRTQTYYEIELPFSYRPTGYAIRLRNRGTYFKRPDGKGIYYPRQNGKIIRDVEFDLKEDGRPFLVNNRPVVTAEEAGEEPIYKTFEPIPAVKMDFNKS